MLANASLSVRLDTFRPSNSIRLKFASDQAMKETYVAISSLKENPSIIGDEARRLAKVMKLKPAAKLEDPNAGTPPDMR